jgi:hypothetical protein
MSLESVTAIILLVVTFTLIFYDIYAKIKVKDGTATISWVILTAAKSYPILAFAAGLLCGHLFWQNCNVP